MSDKDQPTDQRNNYIGAGIAIGVAVGAAMDNMGAGIAIGIAIGAAMGHSAHAKQAKDEQDK